MQSRKAQQGASLLEALIALLVAGFGMLALVAMQITLARSADVARQRGEATRIAQQKVEDLRTLTNLANFDAETNSIDTPSGPLNTVFTRTTKLIPDEGDTHRIVRVTVAWEDRASEPHHLDLRTVIARSDPKLSGEIEFPPAGNQALRRPKNRNMNIPVPAKELGGGKSSLPFGANGSIVFGNDSGTVVKQCSFVVESLADLDDSRCVTLDAYLLAGYVTKTMTSFPASLGINTSLITTSGSGTMQCIFGDATDQNIDPATGLSRVSAPNKYDIIGTKYYLCVVPVASGGGTWSGEVRLSGMATGTDHLVCRFEYPESQGGTVNERHPKLYSKVDTSLDNQNYIITTGNTCPIVDGLQTQLNQDCRASNAQRLTDCPADPNS
jgi:Tfp pilus assembly protein PilV